MNTATENKTVLASGQVTPIFPVFPNGASAPEEYITKEEVARRLKKTIRTVENWQRKGILPFVKAGRSVLFKWSDVEMHLQSNFRVCRKS